MFLLRKENTDVILNALNIPAGYRVLDVGCGSGELIKALSAEVSAHFTGLDIDEGLIAHASMHKGANEEYLCGDATALPFPDDSFDLVISHTFFTSIFDAETAMKEMQRVCKSGHIIASITTDCTVFVPHDGGVYPPFPWAEEFRVLRNRLDEAFHRQGQRYLTGVRPENMPRFFAASGLEEVHVHAVGKFSCLSNEDVAFRETYLRLEYEAEQTRIHLLPEEDRQRYLQLLRQRQQDLSQPENRIWDWSGGSHLLITAANTKRMLRSHEDASLAEACRNLLQTSGRKLERQTLRAHVESVSTVTLRDAATGTTFSGTGATPRLASLEADKTAAGYLLAREAGDDRVKTPAEIVRNNPLVQRSLLRLNEQLQNADEAAFAQELSQWGSALPTLEFTGLVGGETACLPRCILDWCYGDSVYTGTSEGEALTAGLYTVCQEYALKRLLRERLTPPALEIPWAQYPMLQNWVSVLQGQDYRLRFFDCSLGEGIPALGILLIKNAKTRIAVRADLSLEKAVEKCLLSLLARRTASTLISGNSIIKAAPPSVAELYNIMETGEGALPASLFGAQPGWEPLNWNTGSLTPEEERTALTALFQSRGWEVWLRDCSRAGLSACQVIVPDIGMTYDFGTERLLEYRLSQMARPILARFPTATPQEQELAMKYVWLKQNWQDQNSYAFLRGSPEEVFLFGVTVDAAVFTGLYLLSQKKFAEAAGQFPPKAPEFQCLKAFLIHQDWNAARELFGDKTVGNVQALLRDPWGVLRSAMEA